MAETRATGAVLAVKGNNTPREYETLRFMIVY